MSDASPPFDGDHRDTLLTNVPGWSPSHVEALQGSWVTTAEQVVAVAATAGGVRSLAQQMEVDEIEAERLVDLARHALSPEVRSRMEEVVDTSDYGLGVFPPRTS